MTFWKPVSSFTMGLLLFYSSYSGLAARQEQQDTQKSLEQKAFALLIEIIEQAPNLKLVENRVMIQATAAGLIWKKDEKQAREVFKSATASIAELMSTMDQSNPQYDSMLQTLSELRINLLDIITQFDPQLALELLHATRQPSPPRRHSSYSPPDIEIQLEGRLAGLIAAKDPQRALQIARASLRKGLSFELIHTLSQLRSSDKEAAATLYREIIARLRAENRMTPDVSGIVFSLAYMYRSQEEDVRSFRELLSLLIESALNASFNSNVNQAESYLAQNLLSQLQPLMPEIEKYAPSRVAALRQKFAELDRVTDPYIRSLNDIRKLTQEGTVEEALEAVAKMPPESSGQGYQQVIRKAASQGEFDRARQIANSEALEPIQRNSMLEEIDRQALWQAANQGKLDEARQMLTKLHSLEERASVLVQLARLTSGKNDRETARQLLAEAFDTVAGKAANYQHLQAQLQVAQAYVPFDLDRSFEIMTRIINQLNDLMAAAAALDGFENIYLKNGEWMPTGGSALSNMVVTCNQQIAALACTDFDRAKSLADQWQRSEVQLKARLMIVQTLLSNSSFLAESSMR
jgi:soluble cytochrome b562